MAEPPPTPSDEEAVTFVRAAAARGLSASRRAQRDVVTADYDFEDAEKLISQSSIDELHKHELDDQYPARQFYVVILKMDIPNQEVPFYVKVGLVLPGMTQGRLISFHPWGLHDRAIR